MRSLLRDKRYIHYALVKDADVEILDEYGDGTGDYRVVYETPVKMVCSVSVNSGNADMNIYGISSDYSYILSTSNMDCPIKEDTVIWFGRDTTEPYNFVVTKVAKSLNNILIAIKEVNFNGSVDFE